MTLTSSPELTAATRTTSPLALTRTIAVEARKTVNTVSGKTLLLLGATLMAVFGLGRAILPASDTTFGRIATTACIPGSWIVMAVSVLLVSGEFARREAAITFTLDPRRGRVLTAKAVVAVGLALAAACWALIVAGGAYLLAPALAGATLPPDLEPGRIAVVFGGLVFTALAGLALGLLTRNAVAPIVVMLVWPTFSMLIARSSEVAQKIIPWIDIEPVASLFHSSSQAWAQLGTSVLAWIVLPGVIGAWRLFRGDL
ncbi:hypothetical protein [[Pseudopropionibacterium] massiliense]|uniref:hypothetical protein n=1 Tax=[Pseudopropionibacterium] massiliense TaxID=2220000 RepID=UPI0010309273|nr:hypothetical protein [[Pseudopropionibacterium] massiliense]